MEVILFIVGLLLLVFVGVFEIHVWRKLNTIGTLRVDKSDPDEPPYLFLELNEPIHSIGKHKYVVLKVNLENYISHE